jgi:hypothetical protein
MIESFETLIFEYSCFGSDAAHKLIGAEQDWRNLDGRNHTDCDTLLHARVRLLKYVWAGTAMQLLMVIADSGI